MQKDIEMKLKRIGGKEKKEGIVYLFDFLNCIFKNQFFNAEFKNMFLIQFCFL